MSLVGLNRTDMTVLQKLWQVQWFLVFVLLVTAGIGVAMLYSAANGSFDPWATRQIARFAVGIVLMFIVAVTDIRFLAAPCL